MSIANINKSAIIKFFICSLMLVMVSDMPSNWGFLYFGAQGIQCILLLAIILLPLRPALVLFLLIAVAGKDIVSSSSHPMYSTASIWQMQYGPIRPSWLVFGCIFLKLIQSKVITVAKQIRPIMLWFSTVPIAMGFIAGGLFTDHAGTEAIVDIKMPLMLFASTILFQTAYRKDQRCLGTMLSAFVGALLARHLMDLLQFLSNYGPIIAAGISRGSEDSAKGGVILLIFFGVCQILTQRDRLIGITLAILSFLLLAAYGTRMLWITFLMGAVVQLHFLDLRRRVIFIAVTTIITIGGCWSLFVMNPDSAIAVLARSKMITEGRSLDKFVVDVDYNTISRIDPIRYVEIVNIVGSLKDGYAVLFGTGYGGYYEDAVVSFPYDLRDSFPQYSLDTRKFYRAHGFLQQIYLKYGVFGLVIITSAWLIPLIGLLKIFRKESMFREDQPRLFNSIMLSMAAFVPTAMLQLYWSGKGLFINGIILSSCMEFVRIYRAHQNKLKLAVL